MLIICLAWYNLTKDFAYLSLNLLSCLRIPNAINAVYLIMSFFNLKAEANKLFD